MKLSIIIPVYNVFAFLERCLDSILREKALDMEQLEVILVNDGSTDDSQKIIEEYSRKFSCIKTFFHTNSGLSYTRNVGLMHSSGDYIWFVDSDDYLCSGWSRYLFSCLEMGHDVIALTTIIKKNNLEKVMYRNHLAQKEYTLPYFYSYGYKYPYSGVQFYIFKRALLIDNSLQFKVGLYYEDLLFTPIAFTCADSCFYLINPIYVYVIRSGSITTSDVSLRKSSDILKIADELYLFLKTNSLSVKYKRMIYSSIATIAGVYYSVFYAKLNVHEQIEVLSMFFNRAYWIKSFILSGKIYYFIRWLKMYYLNVKYEYFFSKKSSKYNFED